MYATAICAAAWLQRDVVMRTQNNNNTLQADPSEHVDLSKSEPAVFSRLLARFKDLEESYHPPKTNPPPDADGLCAAIKAHGGFMHPWR
eukprot:SAG11_NODE_723_length_7528_cov_4.998385_8_plen_89_part_00